MSDKPSGDTVHILNRGKTYCGYGSVTVPAHWGPTHKFVPFNHVAPLTHATCLKCIDAYSREVRPTET